MTLQSKQQNVWPCGQDIRDFLSVGGRVTSDRLVALLRDQNLTFWVGRGTKDKDVRSIF
jgi:hypothetical protein